MLRITTQVSSERRTLRVEGKLCRAGAAELEACWKQARAAEPHLPLQVDLAGVTFVDDTGRTLLEQMHAGGATLVGCGCATRKLIDDICSEEET